MPPVTDERVLQLIEKINENVFNCSQENWLHTFQEISKTISSGPGGLAFFHENKKDFEIAVTTMNTELLEGYSAYYRHISPFRKKIENIDIGKVFRRSENLSDAKFKKTEIFRDYFRKQDVFHFDYRVLFKDSNVKGSISFSRPESMEDFSSKENELIEFLLPHISQAFYVYYKLNEYQKINLMLESSLNLMPQQVLILDKQGKVIFVNDEAQKTINEKNGIQIDRDGNLKTDLSTDTMRLKRLLHNVFSTNIKSKSAKKTIKINRRSSLKPLNMLATQISKNIDSGFEQDEVALLFIDDPEKNVQVSEKILSELYELTPTESKITRILAEGRSLKSVCKELKIKENTGRTHLKKIFSKTDTNRQGELVKEVLTSLANCGIK